MWLLLMASLGAAELTGTVDGAERPEALRVEAVDTTLRVLAEAEVAEDGSFQLSSLPAVPLRLRAFPADELAAPDAYHPSGDSWCEGALVVLAHGETRSDARIAVERGGTLTGRVVTATGVAAEGAWVIATPVADEPIDWERVAEIDSDGAFRLTGLPTQASGLRLALEADGLPGTNVGGYDLVDAEEFVLSEGEERDLGTLQFGTGVSVGGHVVDEAGEPVEGVVVRVRIEGVTERTTTDPGGAWTIDAIRPGSATVWVAHDDWAIHYWPGADRPAERIKVSDDGDVVDDVRLELLPEATLSGVISGLPEGLGDLELRAVNDDESVQIKVEVDTEGAFTAHRLAAGEWSLLVMGEGLGGVEDALRDADGHPRTWRVETGEHVDVGELPWVAEGVLEGRVSDSDGQPIQGAEVTAWPDAADLPQVSATTDDHGRYRLVGLVEGPYRVVAGFEAVCVDDPDHVDAWWPEARVQAQAHVLHPVAGQLVDGIDLALPQDLDHDGMDDAWELGRGLDPTRDDGGEDPDGDGYTNLEEYQLGTDPMAMSEDTALGGCGSPWSLSLVLMPLIGLVPCRRRS